MALLEARKLSKDFGGLHALQHLDLAVEAGEIVAIIGPNGSGKTTFFNVVSGIRRATAGSVQFAGGHELTRLPAHRITALGIARTFQNQRLFNQMTVIENVLVGMYCRTRAGLARVLLQTPLCRRERRDAEERALALLALFGQRLLPRRDEPAFTLSGS